MSSFSRATPRGRMRRSGRSDTQAPMPRASSLLTVTATFQSWDFRWAYVVKYANDYRLTVEQRRALLDKTLAESQDSHRFYVALYGTKWRWDDLTKPTSAWIVRLIDEKGNETAPTHLELLMQPIMDAEARAAAHRPALRASAGDAA